MNTQPLKYYRTRYGAFGIVPADSPVVGDAVEVGAARKEEYARLFAAAPELLNELRKVAWALKEEIRKGDKGWEMILTSVEAQIAKATE